MAGTEEYNNIKEITRKLLGLLNNHEEESKDFLEKLRLNPSLRDAYMALKYSSFKYSSSQVSDQSPDMAAR